MATAKSTPVKKPSAAKSASAARAPAKAVAAKAPARTPAKPGTARKSTPARSTASLRRPTAARRKAPTRAERAETSHIDRIWELAERMNICMFITWDGERQRARPLAAHVDRKEHAIYFLTDTDGMIDNQLEKFPTVSLAFSDTKKNRYVAITGQATLSSDRGKIKQLWTPFAKAWWSSPEDPKIRVIRVSPQDAELWDSPGRIGTTVAIVAAALTGRAPKLLDNAKVAI